MNLPSIEDIAEAIGVPANQWRNRCHEISLMVVKSGIIAPPGPDTCRVARGVAIGYGIGSQHSWISLGWPFDPDTVYVDVTAHAWGEVEGIVCYTAMDAYKRFEQGDPSHVAHGFQPSSIWKFGRPSEPTGEPIALDASGLSDTAQSFLEILGPLDTDGWADLLRYPQGAWPCREIANAIVAQVPRVMVDVPIDVLGHASDANPSGYYW